MCRNYPDWAQKKLLFIRELILEVASEINGTPEVEETLKWGEPSYLTEQGSTIRMDWKKAALLNMLCTLTVILV